MSDKIPPRRGRGRPRKDEADVKRNNVTMRMRDGLKERLQSAADNSGRSLSEEIETRLTHSFSDLDVVSRFSETHHGKEITGFLMAIERVASQAGTTAALADALNRDPGSAADLLIGGLANAHDKADTNAALRGWLHNPAGYEAAAEAIATIIDTFRPAGERHTSATGNVGLGEKIAILALFRIAAPQPAGFGSDTWSAAVRERLGPEVLERIRTALKTAAAKLVA